MTHRFKQLLLFTVGTITSLSVHAGSANAIFDCQSASGRTFLKASVPGDHAEHLVELNIDKQAITWKDVVIQNPPYNNDKNSSIFVLGSMKAKNYHFLITTTDQTSSNPQEVFRFSAIPSSINIQQTTNGERGTLSAIIVGEDPRSEKSQKPTPKIVVNCTYAYEI